jgi:hypothetical protein
MRGEEALLVPTRVAAGTEKIGAHVVVHAMDLPAKLGKIGDDFGTDEAGGTGDEELHKIKNGN